MADGSTARARVRDVSKSGVCFFVERALPLMSVLSVALRLPDPPAPLGGAAALEQGLLRARGAVVRCQRISPSLEHFEVAVFLHEISAHDQARLERYVARTPSAAV